MNRVVNFAAGSALVVALAFGIGAAAVAPAHLSYVRVFDTQRANFLHEPQPASANLVSDAAFGIDVELPIYVQTASRPLYDRAAAPSAIALAGALPPIAGITFRLNDAKIQMQYQRPALQPAQQAPPAAETLAQFASNLRDTSKTAQYTTTALPSFDGAASSDQLTPFAAPSPAAQRLTLPVSIGPVHFATTFQASGTPERTASSFDAVAACGTADPNSACTSLHQQESRFAAGTSFNVRAGARRVNLHVGGSVERQSLPNDAAVPSIPLDPHTGFAGTGAVAYPNAVDVTKHGVNADVAVPVTRHVTVNLGYDTQHVQGGLNSAAAGADSQLPPSIDARKNTYLGNITYQLPHSSSAITFSARQYRYQDANLSNLNLTQTRADVNFTVKF